MKLGEALYADSAEGAEAAGASEQPSGAADDGVVDADFEEVNDDKKKD